jgi:hypothetical protein
MGGLLFYPHYSNDIPIIFPFYRGIKKLTIVNYGNQGLITIKPTIVDSGNQFIMVTND